MMRWVIALTLLLSGFASADTSGPAYAGTATTIVNGTGVLNWTSAANATGSSTGTSASAVINGDGSTPTWMLVLTGYTFPGLSSGDGITNITLSLWRSGTGSGQARDDVIQLIIGGSPSGADKADGTTNWPSTAGAATYNWNTAAGDTMPAATDVLSSDFGVGIQVLENVDENETVRVYYAALTITFTVGGGGEGEGEGEAQATGFFALTNR